MLAGDSTSEKKINENRVDICFMKGAKLFTLAAGPVYYAMAKYSIYSDGMKSTICNF